MNIHSLNYFWEISVKTFQRFPFVLLTAIFGSLLSIIMVEMKLDKNIWYFSLIPTCILGTIMFLSMSIFFERTKYQLKFKILSYLSALGFLMLYYISIPKNDNTFSDFSVEFIRFALFSLGLSLSLMFSGFITKYEINGFWEFNKSLVLRGIISVVFSAVLYGGLAVALLSINFLLEIKIPEEKYFELWIFIVGIFNSWFFLAGFPEDIEKLENNLVYPKILKIFVQYILLPLVILYLVILYSYALKIIINMSWPKGGVSYLILGCSFTGIAAFLLIYPLESSTEKSWIRYFSKIFYITLLPLLVMLYFAIDRRVDDYGITENRYFLYVVCFWLFVTSLYFIFNKKRNIILIPVSLSAIAFLTSFGPWSAFSVSYNSQFGRLLDLLNKNKIIQNGKISSEKRKINLQDEVQISSIVTYLSTRNSVEEILKLLPGEIKFSGSYDKPKKIVEAMGIKYIETWRTANNGQNMKYFSFYSNTSNNRYVNISGFDSLFKIYCYNTVNPIPFKVKVSQKEYKILLKNEKIIISENDKNLAEIKLIPIINKLSEKYIGGYVSIPDEEMNIYFENENIKTIVYFNSLNGEIGTNDIKITNIVCEILLKRK